MASRPFAIVTDRSRLALGVVLCVHLGLAMPPALRAQDCRGDCNGNGVVSVEELVRLVNIALGGAAVTSCPPGDQNGDGQITIDELVAAVRALLENCSPTATATATATDTQTATFTATPTGPTATPTATVQTTTPTTTRSGPTATATETPKATATVTRTATRTATGPTATVTPVGPTSTITAAATATNTHPPTPTTTTAPTPAAGAVGVAGRLPIVLKAFTVFPIVTAVMSRGGLAGEDAAPCPLGGTASLSIISPTDLRWQATDCRLPAYGGALTVDGSIHVSDAADPPNQRYDIHVTGKYENAGGSTILMGEADLGGRSMGPVPGGMCKTRGVSVRADEGRVRATTPDGRWAEIGFVDTMLSFAISSTDFDANCLPKRYGVGLTGAATLSSSEGGFAEVSFDSLNFGADDTTSTTQFTTLFGGMASPCIGGAVQLTAPVLPRLGWSTICPSEGGMVVDFGQQRRSYMTYSPAGVEFDVGFDDTIDYMRSDCRDSLWLGCP